VYLVAAIAVLAAACAPQPEAISLKRYESLVGSVLRDCVECPELIVVPPGTFVMGFDGGEAGRPEGPRRSITLPLAFAAGRTEVTHAQFAAFVAATGYQPAPRCLGWSAAQRDTIWHDDADWRSPAPGVQAAPGEPVVCVSWLDARAYAAWLSRRTGHRYRLPTEAEWEYLARAGSDTQYSWGNDDAGACRFANVYDLSADESGKRWPPAPCNDGQPNVAPVGRYAPNGFGLHDLTGNVWEWTADCYTAPYPAQPLDGAAVEVAGACALRVVRGGSWRTHLFRQRVTWRGRDPEDRRSDIFGFRVVRDLP
jgi:formylglycine-generating enzyme required for sulfatase activity